MTTSQFKTFLKVPSGSLRVPARSTTHTVGEDNSAISIGVFPIQFSLVIPTYKEAQNIKEIIRLLSDLLDKAIPHDYELIIVDDNSPDRTWKLALAMMFNYPQLRVMRRVGERGLSSAVIR